MGKLIKKKKISSSAVCWHEVGELNEAINLQLAML
jgi:hypothetical protein